MRLEPTAVIAHNDFDGVVSGVLLSKVFHCKVDYVNYRNLDEVLERVVGQNLAVIIADISLSAEQYERYKRDFEQGTILVIDHHYGTEKDGLVGKPGIYWDKRHSGSDLTLKWLMINFPECKDTYMPYADLALMARDYDLWEHKNPKSIFWNALLAFHGYSNYHNRFMENPSTKFTKNEMEVITMLAKRKGKVEEYINDTIGIMTNIIDSHKLGIVQHTQEVQEFFFETVSDYMKSSDVDLILIIYENGKCSMRSKDINIVDHDVWGLYFKGHEHAAGLKPAFTSDEILDVVGEFYE